MRFSVRERETAWEMDRLLSLPEEEQKVVGRWVARRLSWTWQTWVAILLVWTATLGCHELAQAAIALGAGPLAVVGIWVVGHAAYGVVAARLLVPVHRRVLREFLLALDAHQRGGHPTANS